MFIDARLVSLPRQIAVGSLLSTLAAFFVSELFFIDCMLDGSLVLWVSMGEVERFFTTLLHRWLKVSKFHGLTAAMRCHSIHNATVLVAIYWGV